MKLWIMSSNSCEPRAGSHCKVLPRTGWKTEKPPWKELAELFRAMPAIEGCVLYGLLAVFSRNAGDGNKQRMPV